MSSNKKIAEEIVTHLQNASSARELKEMTLGAAQEESNYKKATQIILSNIGKEMSLASLVKIEEFILEHKKDNATKNQNKEALSSISAGLVRVDNAYDALKIINNVENYKIATRILSDQDFISGLPKDSFIKFCDGQRKSIENAERNDYHPIYVKQFNKARIDCIDWAKGIYQYLQFRNLSKIEEKEPNCRVAQIFSANKQQALQKIEKYRPIIEELFLQKSAKQNQKTKQATQSQGPVTQQQSNIESSEAQKQNTQKSDLDR